MPIPILKKQKIVQSISKEDLPQLYKSKNCGKTIFNFRNELVF